jgi:hypothetical protein
VTSLVVRREGVPEPLGPHAFLLPGAGGPAAPPRPIVHLVRVARSPNGGVEELLVAETLLPDRGPIALEEARSAVLAAVTTELPFLERHLLVVDSVHDGLPVWVYDGGKRRSIDRAALKGASSRPEPMVRKLEVDPPGYVGIAGEPIRGPIERTLLVGRSVMPGLGQEGQLLAAWGAARLVTRTDRQKERMRRDMWSKVEIG